MSTGALGRQFSVVRGEGTKPARTLLANVRDARPTPQEGYAKESAYWEHIGAHEIGHAARDLAGMPSDHEQMQNREEVNNRENPWPAPTRKEHVQHRFDPNLSDMKSVESKYAADVFQVDVGPKVDYQTFRQHLRYHLDHHPDRSRTGMGTDDILFNGSAREHYDNGLSPKESADTHIINADW